MKNRKISLIAMILLLAICLTSCSLIFGGVADKGNVTVVVETAEGYEVYQAYLEKVENKNDGALGVLTHLSEGKDKLRLEKDHTGFITAIGSIEQDPAAGAYVMVYTSVASDGYEGAPTVEYEGMTLYQSGVGVTSMTVEEGTVILFRLETFSY